MKIIFKHIIYLLLFSAILTAHISFAQTETDTTSTDDFTAVYEDDDYLLYEGKKISKIYFNLIDVSGPSLGKVNGSDTSWFGNIANSLHFKTREWVVRDLLLFSEGDPVEAKIIAESERLLRASGYFYDARITVNDAYEGDSLDLLVTTKDRWTLTLNVSYSTKSESYFGIKDDNFLGFGHSIDAAATHNNDELIGFGGRANYTAYNVASSYINAGAAFRANKRYNIQTLSLSRPFISTELEWAGGLEFRRESNKFILFQQQSALLLPYRVTGYNLWGGKSFPVWFGDKVFKDKTRIILSGRINKVEYSERPDETYNLSNIFSNSVIFLAKGGIINRRFYKEYYVDGFGHTEDVPIGGSLSITAGTERRNANTRIYSGIRGLLSRRIEDFGYASLLMEFGGFRIGDRWEQNVYNFNFLFHSHLIKGKEWNHRILMRGDYLLGFNRFRGEQIYLNEDTGIRGMQGIHIFGSKRGVLNLEWRVFSPFSLLGFQIGANVFSDLGLLSPAKKSLVESKLFQAYGAGFRVSNELIARAQFEIGIVYNPFNPQTSKGTFTVLFSTGFLIGIRNIDFFEPSIVAFQNN